MTDSDNSRVLHLDSVCSLIGPGYHSSHGSGPGALAFDGRNLWVVNVTGTVVKLHASTNNYIDSYPVKDEPCGIVYDGVDLGSITDTDQPACGMAFDGANVWVANNDETLSKF